MTATGRWLALGATVLLASGVLSGCSGGTGALHNSAAHGGQTTTTTTIAPAPTTASSTTTTSRPAITVPNVIGLKIAAAKTELAAVGLRSVGINKPCNRGTLASQSVAEALLAVLGNPPDVSAGAVPLNPGAVVAPGTKIGITWSGCFGGSSAVPDVIGLSFAAARHALHAAGLTWACYSVGGTTTTTARPTTHQPQTVLSQDPPPATMLPPGTPVSLTMHHCPQ